MSAQNPIWSSLPVPALVVDERDVILRINPAAEMFLNASSKSMVGQPIWDKVIVGVKVLEGFRQFKGATAYPNKVVYCKLLALVLGHSFVGFR